MYAGLVKCEMFQFVMMIACPLDALRCLLRCIRVDYKGLSRLRSTTARKQTISVLAGEMIAQGGIRVHPGMQTHLVYQQIGERLQIDFEGPSNLEFAPGQDVKIGRLKEIMICMILGVGIAL